ncbi:hypothetical protein B0T14DRAFT_426764 [Immersiella caudata]|uniref:Uncharacterized protein n=1 Tax=Immersiella caudata TaxID=314043 RepID=A0AA39WYB7_9PEZI|nr:hypothetical protein B0T14DRAFT_426764 [Immersiella caudata]
MSARWNRRGRWASTHYPVASRFFANDGKKYPLRVPGFNLPVDVELTAEDRFAHGFDNWAQARLTAREIAMLQLMNDITDRPGWDDDEGVFKDSVVASWRDDAISTKPLISNAAWEWCIAELRDAAQVFRKTRSVDVLHSASGVCKSDGLISSHILSALRAGAKALAREEGDSSPSQKIRQDLVDPTLFPLAYGATPAVFDNSFEVVELEGIFNSLGQRGASVPAQSIHDRPETPPPLDDDGEGRQRWSLDDRQKYCWSPGFQLLPCEVQFPKQEGGVTISSYINNLHPGRYPAVYNAIESVLEAAIPMWNRVLVKQDGDRLPPRIRTYGAVIEPQEQPPWLDRAIEAQHSFDKDKSNPAYQEALSLVEEYFSRPEPSMADMLPAYLGQAPESLDDWDPREEPFGATIYRKFSRLRHTVHPEPGVSYSYEDWKAGKANRAIVPGCFCPSADHPHQKNAKLSPRNEKCEQFVLEHPDHVFPPSVDLASSFSERGLQVIVKISRTTLTPGENSQCKAEAWHVDGTLNEHLVAGATLVFDTQNVTTPALDFRVEADLDPWECGHVNERDKMIALETTFGLGDTPEALISRVPALQELGSVKFVDSGRLVAYPHGLQHRMGAVELVDKSSPGYFDVLELWLVDPNYRICSTRNVPPQRHDWWFDAVMQAEAKGEWKWPRRLPNEIVEQIRGYAADYPVSMEEARRWQEKRREHEKLCQEAVQHCVDGYMFLEQWLT